MSKSIINSALYEGRVMREGYCVDCDNLPDEFLHEAARKKDSPCNGCWFTDAKANWQSKGGKQYFTDDGTLMNADGSRRRHDRIVTRLLSAET